VLRAIVLICPVLIGGSSIAFAQLPLPLPLPLPPVIDTQGSPEERAACYPDVQRFCRGETGDTFRVLTCLQNNRPRISSACRGVLQSHGQ
jgi:hypothetical protein